MGKSFCSPLTRKRGGCAALIRQPSFVEEAADRVSIAYRPESRRLSITPSCHELGAAGMEGAAARPVVGMRHGAPDRLHPLPPPPTKAGNEPQNGPGEGRPRPWEDPADRPCLAHPPRDHP